MKKILLIAVSLCAYNASAHMESKSRVKYAGDISYSGFCQAIVADDVNLLKRNIRLKVGEVASSQKDVLKKLMAQDGMKCNGTDLMSFSKQREASNVHSYLTSVN